MQNNTILILAFYDSFIHPLRRSHRPSTFFPSSPFSLLTSPPAPVDTIPSRVSFSFLHIYSSACFLRNNYKLEAIEKNRFKFQYCYCAYYYCYCTEYIVWWWRLRAAVCHQGSDFIRQMKSCYITTWERRCPFKSLRWRWLEK